jgi:uncharacterized integral membrane protein
MRARLIAILVLLVILIIFIVQNTGPVSLRFLFWRDFVSLVVIILASFAVGVLLGFVFGRVRVRRRVKKEKKAAQEPVPLPPTPPSS